MTHFKVTIQTDIHVDAENEKDALKEIKKFWEGEVETMAALGCTYWNSIPSNKKILGIKALKTDFYESKWRAGI